PQLPRLTRGGRSVDLTERGNTLLVHLDYSEAEIHAFKDLTGKALLNPEQRKREISGTEPAPASHKSSGGTRPQGHTPQSVAEQWYALGLIDERAHPTRRGILFSFFNHGEGLAI